MTGETELRALTHGIDERFEELGIPAESRAFKAHLTLGRVKGEMTPDDARALGTAAELVREPRGFSVRTVDLMHSELGPGGPRYSVLGAAPLHRRGT
jgi:2'-5' RNA ligase